MGEKKKPGRFTLQFNLEDPQQRRVSALLEQQGRRKAQFLTSAVLCYTHTQDAGGAIPVDEARLEQMIRSILKKQPSAAVSPEESAAWEVPPTHLWDSQVGADTMRAISQTLAAFQNSGQTA